ncbi:hypothetical protein DXX92_03205 [Thalassotalea euphylliae]|uniref:Uncharacterized protein n=1 Tax=Thalassotalea euphylliae TaxID=1655234 RepID=A0A3E0UBQ8_9GAMM|nr:hypothetical protein DXX92_03205 [Thalassotalea euphylliae]
MSLNFVLIVVINHLTSYTNPHKYMFTQLEIKRFNARRMFARHSYSISRTCNTAVKCFSQALRELFSSPITAANFLDVERLYQQKFFLYLNR